MLTVHAGTHTFVRSGGSFLEDGFRIGNEITTSGFVNPLNNGVFHVTAVTSRTLTVMEPLVTENAGQSDGDERIAVSAVAGPATEAYAGGVLTIDADARTITRSTGSFIDDGFIDGHKINTSGFSTTSNNGTFHLTTVTASTLTVREALVDEEASGASGNEKIQVFVPHTEPGTTIHVDAASNSFTRTNGSFEDDGFVEGQRFTAYGFSANRGDYLVKTVEDLRLEVHQVLVSETGSGDELLVVQGKRGVVLDKIFALRDKVEMAAINLGPRIDLGLLVETFIDDVVTGAAFDPFLLDDLFRAYLYNWVDEINEGVRHWGEVGLGFAKALFDAQSRRELQNIVAETDGPDTLDNTLRAHTEAGVGFMDVLLNELDDPNGDRSTTDSFINKHLLPMFGLPEELGVLRAGLQDFSTFVGDLLDPLQIFFNPIEATIDDVREAVTDLVKDEIEEAFGFSFEVLEFLTDLASKMDLASVTGNVFGFDIDAPIFKPGDHEKLDALLGITSPDHHLDLLRSGTETR